jgi:hypothetical protein
MSFYSQFCYYNYNYYFTARFGPEEISPSALREIEYISCCSGYLKREIEARRHQQYCVSKNAELLEQVVSLHINVMAETYETDYEMSCTSGIRGRRKRRTLRRWVVCVCAVCMCVWCPSLRCGFASRSVREVWSCLCMIHMKQTPWGRNWYAFLTAGRNSYVVKSNKKKC